MCSFLKDDGRMAIGSIRPLFNIPAAVKLLTLTDLCFLFELVFPDPFAAFALTFSSTRAETTLTKFRNLVAPFSSNMSRRGLRKAVVGGGAAGSEWRGLRREEERVGLVGVIELEAKGGSAKSDTRGVIFFVAEDRFRMGGIGRMFVKTYVELLFRTRE